MAVSERSNHGSVPCASHPRGSIEQGSMDHKVIVNPWGQASSLNKQEGKRFDSHLALAL